MSTGDKKDASRRRRARKKLVATGSRREGACTQRAQATEQASGARLFAERRRSDVSAPVDFYKKVAASDTKLAATCERTIKKIFCVFCGWI